MFWVTLDSKAGTATAEAGPPPAAARAGAGAGARLLLGFSEKTSLVSAMRLGLDMAHLYAANSRMSAQDEFILYDLRGWMVSFCTVSISSASSSWSNTWHLRARPADRQVAAARIRHRRTEVHAGHRRPLIATFHHTYQPACRPAHRAPAAQCCPVANGAACQA